MNFTRTATSAVDSARANLANSEAAATRKKREAAEAKTGWQKAVDRCDIPTPDTLAPVSPWAAAITRLNGGHGIAETAEENGWGAIVAAHNAGA